MNKDLNLLEKTILYEIADFNYTVYPFIKNHIPLLKVNSRESTGVGMYIYFEYLVKETKMINFTSTNTFLSSNKRLVLDSLKNELNYELNITDGKIDFLELVTNDENWDGNYNSFELIE